MRLYQCKYCRTDTTSIKRNTCPKCQKIMGNDDYHRRSKGFYNTQRWKRMRKAHLMSSPLCKCGQSASIVDHIKPHKGSYELFWDCDNNWQSLCRSCHNRKTRAGL